MTLEYTFESFLEKLSTANGDEALDFIERFQGGMLSVAITPLAGKYGYVLTPFFTMMEKELHANADKGDRPGWLSMTPEIAMLEIYYHVAKLQKAVKSGDSEGVKEYSADVANMAMMMADLYGVLLDNTK